MFTGSDSALVSRLRYLALVTILGLVTCALWAQNSAVPLPPVKSGSWAETGPMSEARTGAAAVVLQDGSLLMSGGTDASGNILATVEVFGADGAFHAVAPMQTARAGHTATLLPDGRVLVTGGATQGGGTVNSAEVYDPVAKTWTTLSSMVEARAGHTATALPGGDVLLAGGKNSSGTLASLEVFRLAAEAFSPAGTMSSSRSAHAAAALKDGRVFLVGGTDANGATLVSSDLYDPSAGALTPGPALNTPRTAATATTLLNGTVLIAGGSDPEGAVANGNLQELQTAEIFDPVAGTIVASAANLNWARSGQLAFLLPNNNSVLLTGGTSAGTDLPYSELYLPSTQTFAVTGSMTTARSQAAGGALYPLANGLLLVAGGSNSASAELYGFPTIKTDQSDYAPGTTVAITGSGWQPGETVSIYLHEMPAVDATPVLNVVADQNGQISNRTFAPDNNDFGVDFFVTAVGASSQMQAQTKFADGLAPYISVNCVPGSVQIDSPTLCTVSVISHSTCIPADGTTITWTSTTGSVNPATCALSGLSCAVNFTPSTAPNAAVTAEYPVTPGCAAIEDTFTESVQNANPAPVLLSLTPGSANAEGAGFPLIVTGKNFVTGAVVYFNGSARSTTYGSPTQVTATILSADLANAGTFNVTVDNPSPGGGASNPLPFTVNPLPPTLALSDNEVTYDGQVHVCPGTATGVGGATVAGSWSFSPAGETNAGFYPLTGTFTSSDPNYTSGGTASCTLQIGLKPVTAIVTAANKTYDGTLDATITTCKVSGLVPSDINNVTCSVAAASFVSAGAGNGITVNATGITLGGSAAGNYMLSLKSAAASANIYQAALTVTAGNASMTYGGIVPQFNCTITGGLPGDTFTCSFSPISIPTATGSPYAIVPIVSGANLANYAVTYNDGQLTVNPAAQTIKCPVSVYYTTLPLSPCIASSGLPVTYTAAGKPAQLTTTPNSPTLSFTGEGAASLTVIQPGNGNYLAAPTVTVSFKVLAEPIYLAPAVFNFPITTVGDSSPAKTLKVTNKTGATMTFQPVPPAADFLVTPATCTANAGAVCVFTLTFQPLSTTYITGELTILVINAGGNTITALAASLAGSGVGTISATSLVFPPAHLHTTETGFVTITNNTGWPLIMSTISLPAVNFYTNDVPGNTCVAETLAIGASCQVPIVFRPLQAGTHNGTLSVFGAAVTHSGRARVTTTTTISGATD